LGLATNLPVLEKAKGMPIETEQHSFIRKPLQIYALGKITSGPLSARWITHFGNASSRYSTLCQIAAVIHL
jgi:hypothetical protein